VSSWAAFIASTFLRSLRSMPVTALHRYYGRSDSSAIRFFGLRRHELRLARGEGLPASRTRPCGSFRLQTPGGLLSSLSHVTHQLDRLPLWVWTSPAARRLVTPSGRIEFVILRTDPSSPVALHPASRPRSYVQLTGWRTLAWKGLAPFWIVCARRRTGSSPPGLRCPPYRSRPGPCWES
jgi:hypothetical protein